MMKNDKGTLNQFLLGRSYCDMLVVSWSFNIVSTSNITFVHFNFESSHHEVVRQYR
ncbi:hypothetical protein Mapa_007552 [Marchantia paleacea]|nr:hypothetical protein Mapa_007552 [Marchantia paleacea]